MRSIRGPLCLVALTTAAMCGNPTAPNPVGDWGGTHVALTLTATGGAAEYDCAHGSVLEPVRVDADGRFDARGTFVRERGGPIRIDETLPAFPARYAGFIVGDVMTLTVTRTDSAIAIGTFLLRRGGVGQVVKCL